MEKIKFAGQVLLYVTVIPVLFVGTLTANDASIEVRMNNRPQYTNVNRTHVKSDPRVARVIISCRPLIRIKK